MNIKVIQIPYNLLVCGVFISRGSPAAVHINCFISEWLLILPFHISYVLKGNNSMSSANRIKIMLHIIHEAIPLFTIKLLGGEEL